MNSLFEFEDFLDQNLDSQGDFLVNGIIRRGEKVILVSRPKGLKTSSMAELSYDVACGLPAWDHFEVKAPGKVLFVQTEDSPAQLQERYLQILKRHEGQMPDAGHLLITTRRFALTRPDDLASLRRIIEVRKPDVVILDVLRTLMRGGDANDYKATSDFLSNLDDLREVNGSAIVLLHHTNKRDKNDPQINTLGSTNLTAWADVIMELKRTDTPNTVKVNLEGKGYMPEPFLLRADFKGETKGPLIAYAGPADKEGDSEKLKEVKKIAAGMATPFSIPEIAKKTGVSEDTVRYWVREGKLPLADAGRRPGKGGGTLYRFDGTV